MSDFIAILYDLQIIRHKYWTMSAKCVTLHNSACYQISRLCEHLRILMYTNVYYLRLYYISEYFEVNCMRSWKHIIWPAKAWQSWRGLKVSFDPRRNVCWLLQYLLSPTHLFAIAFRELKYGPNLLMFSWYFFLTLLLHDHDFLGISRWMESLELDDTYC